MDLGATGLGKNTYPPSVIRLTSTQQFPFLQVRLGGVPARAQIGSDLLIIIMIDFFTSGH
jgi:hypothetical protein